MNIGYLFSIAGSLVFVLLALLVLVGAVRRFRRRPCIDCGLSIPSGAVECPFCYAVQY